MPTRPVLRRIEADCGLRELLATADATLGDDPGHDVDHCLRVAEWTLRIGGEEVEPREAIAAALLHDIVNVPKDSPNRATASEAAADRAAELLGPAGFDATAVARVREAIRDHSYSRGATPTSALGRALQDADRLDALGAIGIFRTVTCGARLGARYHHRHDPWATDRALDDRRHTLDHFFVKLLRLPETMQTAAGRHEARRRTAFMRAFLRQLGDEIGHALPDDPA